jgi:hypothetical protein
MLERGLRINSSKARSAASSSCFQPFILGLNLLTCLEDEFLFSTLLGSSCPELEFESEKDSSLLVSNWLE